MLELLHALAIRLAWLRPISVLAIVGFGGLFTYAVVTADAPESFLTSGLVGASWALLLSMFLSFFQTLPGEPNAQQTFRQRTGRRLRRFGYSLLALATLILSIGVIVMTTKLIQSGNT